MSSQIGGIVGGIIGAVVGYYVGNPYQGAVIGYSLGSGAQALIAPARQYGPRLDDLRNQTSAYGVDIPERWAIGRQAGNVIWQTDLIQNSVESGSKGGSPTTSYKYTFHTAIGVCKGPILGISRIWANKQIWYDSRPVNTGNLSDPKIGTVRIYLGDETQEVDPLIAAISGAATPAYRGLAYVVLEGVDGTDTQGRIQWEFEVIADGSAATHYSNVCALTAADSGDSRTHGYSWIGGPQGSTIYWWRRANALDLNSSYVYFRSLDGGPAEYLGSDGGPNSLVAEKVPVNTATWPCYANPYSRNNPIFDAGVMHQPVSISFPNGEHATRTVCNDIKLSDDSSLAGGGNLFAYDQDTDVTVISKRDPSHQFFARSVVIYKGGSPVIGGIPAQVLGYDDFRHGTYNIAAGELVCALAATGGRVLVMVYAGGVMRLRILSQTDGTVLDDFPGPALTPDAGTDIQESIVTDGATVWAWCGYANGGTVWRWNADGSYNILATGIGTQDDGGTITDGLGGNRIFIDDASVVMQTASHVQTSGPNVYRIQRIILAAPTAVAVPLSEIVTDLCAESGLSSSDINVSQLTDLVSGYTRPRNMTARAAIEPLQQAYFFDAVESDFILKFVKRGGAIAATIPFDDRAAHAEDEDLPDHLKIVRANELEVPSFAEVQYVDASADYLIGVQSERRLTKQVVSAATLQLPITLTADQAKQIAATSLYASWLTQSFSFSTSRKYAHLEPTDVVALPTEAATYVARITKKSERAAGVIDWEAVAEDANVYAQTASGTPLSYIPATLRTVSRTDLNLLDIPILQDADSDYGAYAKATPLAANWSGATVLENDNATPVVLGAVTVPSVVGSALTALPDYAGIGAFDEGNYVDVYVNVGTLTSVTAAQALGGANAFLIGNGVSGQEEILVARDVVLTAANTYRLSGLLRGQKATPTGLHAIGDRVVKLEMGGLLRINSGSAALNVPGRYAAVSFGRAYDGLDQKIFTNTGRGLMPLPPIHVGCGRVSGDVVLQWQRRTRLAAPLRSYVDAPLGESSEAYQISLSTHSDFGLVVRTITTTTSTATYKLVDQTADGTAGVTIYARISQVSSLVGPGSPATISVTP